jgi:hypothetical protein
LRLRLEVDGVALLRLLLLELLLLLPISILVELPTAGIAIDEQITCRGRSMPMHLRVALQQCGELEEAVVVGLLRAGEGVRNGLLLRHQLRLRCHQRRQLGGDLLKLLLLGSFIVSCARA